MPPEGHLDPRLNPKAHRTAASPASRNGEAHQRNVGIQVLETWKFTTQNDLTSQNWDFTLNWRLSI